MSANSKMITNLYSECWWLALFFLTHWLTLCFMPAVWCTHSSLMILQSFFPKWPIQINYNGWKSMKNANMSRRVSGLGKETVINHKMKRGAENSCQYQIGLTTYLKKKNLSWLIIWFQMTTVSDFTKAKFTSSETQLCVSVCVLCGQPLQVSAWLVVTTDNAVRHKPSKPQLHY